jgi:hypothetical protein
LKNIFYRYSIKILWQWNNWNYSEKYQIMIREKDDETFDVTCIYFGCTHHIIHIIVQRSHKNPSLSFIVSSLIVKIFMHLYDVLCLWTHVLCNDVSWFFACYISFANMQCYGIRSRFKENCAQKTLVYNFIFFNKTPIKI